MSNTGFKGIDVRQTGNELVFRAFLQTSAGALVTSGTTNLYLMELQSDGTIKTYDFNAGTHGFTTAAVTTETLAMTYRKSNNATTDTGLWTSTISTNLGDFTVGAIYLVRVNNSGASPTDQMREFQYGSAEGDLVTTANGTGVAEMNSDLRMVLGTAATAATAGILDVNVKNYNNQTAATDANNYPKVDVVDIAGTASAGAAGYVGVDWAAIHAPTTTVDLSGTTIKNLDGNTVQTGDAFGQLNTLIPHAFTYDSNNLPKVDAEDWKGTAVTALLNGLVPAVTPIRSGTAQAGGPNTITLDAGASSNNNNYQNELIYIYGNTGAGQVNTISSYVGSTKVATMIANWATNPDNTSLFAVIPAGPISATVSGGVNVTSWNGAAVPAPNVAGVPIVDLGYWKGSAPNALTGGLVQADLEAILTHALSETTGGNTAASFKKQYDVSSPVFTAASINQSGDVFGQLPTHFSVLAIDSNGNIKVQSNIKKNQAITAFPFLLTDSTTHAPKPGLGSAVTVTRSLDGGPFGAGTLGAVTEISNGWYWCAWAAADTNGNWIGFRATASGADDLDLQFQTDP